MAWFGNSKGHAKAGRLGGKAQGRKNNPGNWANNPKAAAAAGKKGGAAPHKRRGRKAQVAVHI